ncbi:MAG: HD domain-containing phosphohydrolase, partial [Planctomycetota bacterium]
PIVRHHHENWDGTGYPLGMTGTDIPIGARILSVVDCFDALTSDRPYRPRLSDGDAMQVLRERRGSMYDPLVVDTFIRVHDSMPIQAIDSGQLPMALNDLPGPGRAPFTGNSAGLDEISVSADEMLTLYQLATALTGHVGVSDAGDVIAKHLNRLIPFATCVFYVSDPASNELDARHVVGNNVSVIRGLRIPFGQRLSGWVAANRQTISNSDPILDLGDAARTHALPLRSCISTPLLLGDRLVGVLSLYSEETNGFDEDHRRVIEVVAQHIAHTFHGAIELDSSTRRDSVTGLPYLEQLDRLIPHTSQNLNAAPGSHALLFVDIVDLKTICMVHGRAAGDAVLRHVALHARRGLRVTDILFRNSDDELVAFLGSTDTEMAQMVANRILWHLDEHPYKMIGSPGAAAAEARVTVLRIDECGGALKNLLAVRRHSSVEATAYGNGGVH